MGKRIQPNATQDFCHGCRKWLPVSSLARQGDRHIRQCRACESKRLRGWYARNKDKQKAAIVRRAIERPERLIARLHVKAALLAGQLARTPCWVCGKTNSEAHHASYASDAFLDVVWLCRLHHRQAHQAATL